ncbi:hypothetical protein M7I_2367 [Glarea lozoyensis 74030]|uniref:Uncharacterized protein n=1 Tax=Glarea lozoyensis (strain ATCC 74030 / MF5533) TaxID=1104152 RepID=H0EIK7_GLAL7|nr:hypothetical protein M7I_2367 [Glarea lozoyensis 74030]
MNGEHKIIHSASSSPKAPAKKRIRYTEIPIWAQSVRTTTFWFEQISECSSGSYTSE